ncbi:MAG: hypothetical protein GDA43_22090 [Hormoscilla sp. SP5CHS1]|nr:hypothetical protein [Hormoscilla sp. SP5CHS1]
MEWGKVASTGDQEERSRCLFWWWDDRATVPKRETGFYDNYAWHGRFEKETRRLGYRSDRATVPEGE